MDQQFYSIVLAILLYQDVGPVTDQVLWWVTGGVLGGVLGATGPGVGLLFGDHIVNASMFCMSVCGVSCWLISTGQLHESYGPRFHVRPINPVV